MPSSAPSSASESGGGSPAKAAPGMIWPRPERTGRGPEPAHSRAEIAAAAIALADADGLEGVSMRKIAAALGAGTMSLYNYVPKKEHLFDLMLDATAGEFALPEQPSGDPRADLTLLAHEQLAAMRRHPWLPRLVVNRPSMGPNALRCTEFFLAALADSPLAGGTKMELFAMFNGFVTQFAVWQHTAAGADAERWQADLVTYLGGAIADGRYPHLAAALTAGAGSPPMDADGVFARSLDRTLTTILGPQP